MASSQKPEDFEPRQTANDHGRERPILFSAPMVLALLDGSKTQTRRIIKGSPVAVVQMVGGDDRPTGDYGLCLTHDRVINEHRTCPYGVPGDRLWVREAHALHELFTDVARVVYAASVGRSWTEAHEDFPAALADGLVFKPFQKGFRPSIHMPRWASRISLQITDVRVERLNDISEADALAEGSREPSLVPIIGACWSERDAYAKLWEHINGPGSWAANPWVWVVSFQPDAPSALAVSANGATPHGSTRGPIPNTQSSKGGHQ